LFKNLLSNGHTPLLYTSIVLGATIGLFVAFFINIFTKVSAHATGVGGLVGALLATALSWPQNTLGIPMFGGTLELSLNLVLVLGIVFAGLVGVSRLALGAHTSSELYLGYASGFLSMMLAWGIL
jgi:membrane-associated phospholipid phosphatase